MKRLAMHLEKPIGYYVDHIVCSQNGVFEKVGSYEAYTFPNFQVEPDLTGKGYVPIENRKPSELVHLLLHKKTTTAFERPQVLTHFLHKCAMPLLSFLVVLASAPFCFRYSRTMPIFFTYAIALFAFVGFSALINSALILGETQVLSGYAAILIPFALPFIGFGWKFLKI